jgi:hypothetical protein
VKQTKRKCGFVEVLLPYLLDRLTPVLAALPPSRQAARERGKDRAMKRYEPATPRAGLGLIAVAMTAVTIGALGVLPAEFDSLDADPSTLAIARVATNAPIGRASNPARVDGPDAGRCEVRVSRALTVGARKSRRRRPSSELAWPHKHAVRAGESQHPGSRI